MSQLDNMGGASYERRQQNIMKLRNMFNKQEVVTIQSAMAKTGYAEGTIKGWCKDGNIPLFTDNDHTIVPMTNENKPKWWKWEVPNK